MSNLIKVTSKIEFDSVFMKKLNQAGARALEQTAEALHAEVVQAQVMPHDTGAMQGEKTHIKAGETIIKTYEDGSKAINTITKEKDGVVYIITTSPQARRLYFHPEYHFHKDVWEDDQGKSHEGNPNAKGKWFEEWLPGGKNSDFAAKTFAALYKREAGL